MNTQASHNIQAAEDLIALCQRKNITLATAESCTGGMIGMTLTSVSGASLVYLGGIVSYANEVKEALLGVSHETLATVGAVSEETAGEMVLGAKKALGATLAVSVTGIAGPGGGSVEKPVGLVYIGVTNGHTTKVVKNLFTGDREEIRQKTVGKALALLTELAEAESLSP